MIELIIDSFAGGGGASTGIELALGRSPDIAINHDAVALAMHEVNHPETLHLKSDIWEVDPLQATGGRPVGLGWFSPDCKHFSKAKGGKPVEKKIRGLAWVVVHWANVTKPRVIILENVEEFQTWGPLGVDNKPCPIQKGETFKRWVKELETLGYAVEYRELRACDYGAPTIRKRLFLIARRDGEPIVWPQQTHGDPKSDAVKQGRLKPWRTAAEIIDFSLPCPSIFDSAEEIMAKFGLRAVRPLQAASMARFAKGTRRYVVDAAEPFIVNLTHQGGERTESLNDPAMTATAAHRGEKALAMPFIAGVGGRMAQTGPRGANQPAQTLTAKADSVLVAPFISAAQQGGSIRDARLPLHTATASPKDQNQIIMPVLSAYYGKGDGEDSRANSAGEPLRTQPTENRHALIAAHLTKFRANSVGGDMRVPAPTVTANSFIKRPGGAVPIGVVAAFLAQNNIDGRTGEGNAGRPVQEPVSTVLQSGSHQSLAAVNLLRQFGTGVGSSLDDPARTVMADGMGKTQLAAAFVGKYYGTGEGQVAGDPLHSVTTKDRFGLAELLLDIPPFLPEHEEKARKVADLLRSHGLWDDREFVTIDICGIIAVIVDLGMRMLTPRELFRAQGFPDSYIIDRRPDGTAITKTDQVSKCGNSVCPPMAEALVRANFAPRDVEPAPQFLEAAE